MQTFNLTNEPINKAERVVPFFVSSKKLTKQKYIVNCVRLTLEKNKFLSKKMNIFAKKAVEPNGCGSYPLVFYSGVQISSSMKGMQGGGVPTGAVQELFKDRFIYSW